MFFRDRKVFIQFALGAVIYFFICGLADSKAVDKEKEFRKKHKIKSITIWFKEKKTPGNGRKQETINFDANGNVVENDVYDQNGQKVVTKETHHYDGNGYLVEVESQSDMRPLGPLSASKELNFYDSGGNLIEADSEQDGVKVSKTIYKNDADGNFIDVVKKNASGGIQSDALYARDPKENIIEITNKDGGGNIAYSEKDTCDFDGNVTEKSKFNSDEKLTEKVVYKYKGETLVKETHYDSDGNKINEFEYSCDGSGLIKTSTLTNTKTKAKFITKYAYEFFE